MPETLLLKVPYRYDNVHTCKTVVMMCQDFRFRKKTLFLIEEVLGEKAYDLVGMPGSSKRINHEKRTAHRAIEVACELHKVKKIILINHQDCGAYGGSQRFADKKEEQLFHEQELKMAKDKILSKYPDKEIILIYARLADKKKNIEFLQIS